MSVIERFANEMSGQPAVRGFLHKPEHRAASAIVLTHGAGSNCCAPLLVALADAFAGAGFLVLRCDLPLNFFLALQKTFSVQSRCIESGE